jgi:diaminopimelate epimerase
LDFSQFYKYHGGGNDFVLIEDFENRFHFDPDKIKKICNRNFSIGANGILVLQKSNIADIKMRIFNEDGTEATMCGNGLRCALRHLGKSAIVETLSGLCLGEVLKDSVKVTLPKNEIILSPIALKHNLIGHLANTGTNHLVIFVSNLFDDEIIEYAQNLRYDPMFEKPGVNVNLAKIEDDKVFVRTFEKGVETETLACGTGGGAVSIFVKNMKNQEQVKISFQNSDIDYTFDHKGKIWMEGPAELIFQGTLCLKNES